MGVVAAFVMPHPPMAIPDVANERKHLIGHTISALREAARQLREVAPETVFIITPHAASYTDYIHLSPGSTASGNFAELGNEELSYEVLYDSELIDRICTEVGHEGISAGTQGLEEPALDQGFLIPLHFIQESYAEKDYYAPLFVRCSISGLSPAEHYRFGETVARVAQNMHRRVAIVASASLSCCISPEGPYGYNPAGPVYDSMVCGALSSAEFLPLLTAEQSLREEAAECGLPALQILAGTLDETRVSSDLISYEGPFGIGYAVASFFPTDDIGSDPSRDFLTAFEVWSEQSRERRHSNEDAYISLARLALETYVLTGEQLDLSRDVPEGLPDELLQSSTGVFVTIRQAGNLRGCIGTIMPHSSSLASEICANVIAAGSSDPRFPSITADELDDLIYEVAVLHEPESCTLADLNPTLYGVVVNTPDGRRGIMLPGLEGISSVDEQVMAAALKGGIALGRDEVFYQRFRVTRHL